MRWTNWYTHPADNRYYVFEFREAAHSEEFARDLERSGIAFERGDAEGPSEVGHLFGIHRRDFKEALRLNHLLHGRHRTPFIPHAPLRWGVLILTAGVLAVAVIGWFRTNMAP